jgi:hypothetical protein
MQRRWDGSLCAATYHDAGEHSSHSAKAFLTIAQSVARAVRHQHLPQIQHEHESAEMHASASKERAKNAMVKPSQGRPTSRSPTVPYELGIAASDGCTEAPAVQT